MTAATVRLASACRVATVQAAILIIRGSRTFARCMRAFFGGLCVIHFSSPLWLGNTSSPGLVVRSVEVVVRQDVVHYKQ